jgi:type IV pilus assembly protein PilN
VEDLQGNRNMPVYLLSELVKQLPDGVYINSMKQDNQTVPYHRRGAIQRAGFRTAAQPGQQQPLVDRPELIEITAGTVALSPRDQRRVSNFSMRVG